MNEPWLRDREYLQITPTQFELRVLAWLKNADPPLQDFTVIHSNIIHGDSGEYEIDVHIEFTAFERARFTVLVECKRYSDPVKRDVVMLLEAKLQDTGTHKGIIFSTSGFQSGAIEYATHRGIALVSVVDGRSNYVVRAKGIEKVVPPPWVPVYDYIGWFQTSDDGASITSSIISDDEHEPLVEWLSANPAS